MANDNETVEQVCEKMDAESGEYHIDDYGLSSYEIGLYKERILAANKRELTAKDNERLTVAANYEAVIAAKDRIIGAKDAEIASVMGDMERLLKNGDLLCLQKVKMEREIEERNALIKELADDLSGYLCESECNGACASFGHCCNQTSRQIIAKAREVIK